MLIDKGNLKNNLVKLQLVLDDPSLWQICYYFITRFFINLRRRVGNLHRGIKYFEESPQLLISCPENASDFKSRLPTNDASIRPYIRILFCQYFPKMSRLHLLPVSTKIQHLS